MTSTEREQFLRAGFTADQIEEIDAGIKEGLNVSIYARKDFLSPQMNQIRLGMREKLSVEVYAKPKFDWFQMEEIRKGLRAGINVGVYALPEISYEIMRELRKGLENKIDLSKFKGLNAGVLRQLRKAMVAGVNLLKYINEGYDAEQLAEIREALESKVDIEPYLSKDYRGASIAQIRKGLEAGVDVSCYAMKYYSWRQMREIRKGLENQIAVEKYISKWYSWEQMREIRKGLQDGLDVEGYRLLRYTATEMRLKRFAMLGDFGVSQEFVPDNKMSSADFMFELSSGNMEAYITVLTDGKKITRKELFDILEQNNICKGIQEDAVAQIVGGEYGKKAILIAKGQIPYKGKDGWYEFFFNTNVERKPKKLKDGSVDYQNIEWFEKVQEGWEIAFYHEAEEGTDGYTVTGEIIKARKGFEQRALRGKGFRVEGGKTYIATMSGMVQLEDNEINITNHMELDEVTMATGNVRFDGSVHIKGDVGNGTVVNASGDVVVDGNVEAATITSGGNVVLKKGMNSSGRGQISAGKDVVSRFFEAVKVEAEGNIEVDRCLNSQLYAGGKIVCTRVLAGGVVQAEKGFRLNHVGNQAGLPTLLKLRADDRIWEENRKIKSAIWEIEHELELLNKTYEELKEKIPPEKRSAMELFLKVENAVFAKKKQHEQFLNMTKEYEELLKGVNDARVIITGKAHEGVILDMNGCKWYADNQQNITIKRKDDATEVVNN
uniref:DUF342 domain-containing protein n=1 Tax=Acetatifactor sp. TaxID=1872090 RepID=UPI0040566C7F